MITITGGHVVSGRQIAELADVLVKHQHHFGSISTRDRIWVIKNTETAIGLFAEAVKGCGKDEVSYQNKLLEFMTTIHVAATERFKASEHFKESNNRRMVVQVQLLRGSFRRHFLGKIERASEAADIKVHKLLQLSNHILIVAEPIYKCEITLGQFFSVLSPQGNGEAGPLLTNGAANIACIRDVEGTLWAVCANWNSNYGGWEIGSHSVVNPQGWQAGLQLLSR